VAAAAARRSVVRCLCGVVLRQDGFLARYAIPRRLGRRSGANIGRWHAPNALSSGSSFDGFDAAPARAIRPSAKCARSGIRLARAACGTRRRQPIIDAPPHGLSLADILPCAKNYDLVVLHTSLPSFQSDRKTVAALKSSNPSLKAGLSARRSRWIRKAASGTHRKSISWEKTSLTSQFWTWARLAWDQMRTELSHGEGVIVHKRGASDPREHGFASVRDARIQNATFTSRIISSVISSTHIFPSTPAADANRTAPSVSAADSGRHRYRTRSVGHVIEEIAWAKQAFRRSGIFLRRRHLYRQPSAR